MRKIFRILLYLSLLFFAWYLYRSDYLVFRDITFEPVNLTFSLLLLFMGFTGVGLSWNIALKLKGVPAGFKESVISQGIYIFAKYIPGKLWVIVGRASYFSKNNKSLKFLSLVSLQEQLIFLWWGLALSLPPTLFISQRYWIGGIILAGIVLLSFLLFSGWFHRHSSGILGWALKRDFDFRPMERAFFFKVSLPVLLFWLLWTAGFYLLLISVTGDVQPLLALSFPAGMTYGFIVIFMPAGLGVREGILASFLIAGGLPSGTAVTISVISRFWFIAGEVSLFVLAWIMKLTSGKGAGYPEYPSTSQKEPTA